MKKKEREIAESSLDSAKSQNLIKKEQPTNSKIVDEFLGLCEASDKDRTQGSSRKRAEALPKKSPQAEFVAESRNEKKGKTGFKRIKNAFFYSLSGLKSAFCEEEAFRQIIIVSVILIPLGAYLGENFSEKILLILPCVLAILAELANSAIENTIDFAGLEIHPFAKKAKDMGSAMQLIACLFMGGVWIFYLIQRLLV